MAAPKGHKAYPGGGRPKGSVGKATGDVKALAQEHGAEVIARLAYLALHAKNQQTQAYACEKLLDRAYGKAPQEVKLDATRGFLAVLAGLAQGETDAPSMAEEPEPVRITSPVGNT